MDSDLMDATDEGGLENNPELHEAMKESALRCG